MGFALQANAPTVLGATALRLTKRTKSDEFINTTLGELGTIQTLEASGVDPTGKGMLKVARECGVGSGTVQRIRQEMEGPFVGEADGAQMKLKRPPPDVRFTPKSGH